MIYPIACLLILWIITMTHNTGSNNDGTYYNESTVENHLNLFISD